ncbi:hypothetical protein KIPB_008996, partial [Kipferlia bialata]|eukprot:g8996.t1
MAFFSLLLALFLTSVALADVVCPVTHSYVPGFDPIPVPSPAANFFVDEQQHALCMDIEVAYDPDAAIVLGFSPFGTSRNDVDPVGKCENRYSDTGVWTEPYIPDTAALLDATSSVKWPDSVNAGDWTRSINSCSTVTYSTCLSLDDFEGLCKISGKSPFTVISSPPYFAYSGSVYVTYVYQEDPTDDDSDIVHQEIEIASVEVCRVDSKKAFPRHCTFYAHQVDKGYHTILSYSGCLNVHRNK